MTINKLNNNNSKFTRSTDSFLIDLRAKNNFNAEKIKIIKIKKNKKSSIIDTFKNRFNLASVFQVKKPKFNFLVALKHNKNFFYNFKLKFYPINFVSRCKENISLIHYKKSLAKRLHFNFKRYLDNNEFHDFAQASIVRIKRASYRKKDKKEKVGDVSADYLLVWYRSIFAFMAALVFIILPFKILAYFKVLDFENLKDRIIDQSYSAFDNLASASSDATKLDLLGAESNFEKAAANFSAAQKDLSQVDDWLLAFASFSNNPKIKLAASGKKFLAAGIAASSFGQHLSAAGDIMLGDNQEKSWGKLIDSFVEHGGLALDSAKILQEQLNDISESDLPEEYRSQFSLFRQQTDLTVEAMSTLLNSAKEIKNFLGVSQDKRYLLVFQNNSEMRGAGGFFGSYALVDIRDGQIRKLEVPSGGSYDTEAGMRSYIKAPQALQLVSPRWYFWDANWWPDWPTSAQALMWFYEKSDGPTVDGVISFTPDVLASLLEITGPIDMQIDYGLTIDSNNFWELIQTTVEKDNLIKTHPELMLEVPDSPKNQPKKIIGDLMAIIVEKMPEVLSMENLPSLLLALENNLSSKNILLYFTDPDLENKISHYNLDGKMRSTEYDYLMVTHTNIAGQKTDRKMVEKIKHSIEIMSDGSVVDDLTIYRTHMGLKNEILSGVRNVDWLRVYVPYGSLLLDADGFTQPDAEYFEKPDSDWIDYPFLENTENKAKIDIDSNTKIYNELNKTVFANWVMTDPGQTSIVHLRYQLPFKLTKSEADSDDWLISLDNLLNKNINERLPFSLLVQKQPGSNDSEIELNLEMPLSWQSVWLYPQSSSWYKKLDIKADIIQAVLIEK